MTENMKQENMQDSIEDCISNGHVDRVRELLVANLRKQNDQFTFLLNDAVWERTVTFYKEKDLGIAESICWDALIEVSKKQMAQEKIYLKSTALYHLADILSKQGNIEEAKRYFQFAYNDDAIILGKEAADKRAEKQNSELNELIDPDHAEESFVRVYEGYLEHTTENLAQIYLMDHKDETYHVGFMKDEELKQTFEMSDFGILCIVISKGDKKDKEFKRFLPYVRKQFAEELAGREKALEGFDAD